MKESYMTHLLCRARRTLALVLVTAVSLPTWVGISLLTAQHAHAAAPTLSLVKTQDLDTDGQIDTLEVVFSETVNDTTVNYNHFSIDGGYTISGQSTGATIDDAIVVFQLNESGTIDTSATPTLTYVAGTLTSMTGDPMTSGSLQATDRVSPVITSVTTKTASTIEVVFSETLSNSIQDTDFQVAGGSLPITSVSKSLSIVTITLGAPITGDQTPPVSLADGQWISDSAGNALNGPVSAPATVDGIKPVIAAGVATPNHTGAGNVAVTLTFSEPMNTGIVPTVQVNRISGAPITVAQIAYDNTIWVGSLTLSDHNELLNAAISVSGATDAHGNVMDTNINAATIAVDTVEPTITVTPLKTRNQTPTLNGTVNDNNATIIVTVNGTDYAATNTNGNWNAIITSALSEGIYDVFVRATDTLNNVGYTSAVHGIVIDLSAPNISVSGNETMDIEFGSTYTDAGAAATDNYDATVTITDNGNLINTHKLGTQTITYTATDLAGNTASKTRTVTVVPKSFQIAIAPTTDVVVGKSEVVVPINWSAAATINIPSVFPNATVNLSAYLQTSGDGTKHIILPAALTITNTSAVNVVIPQDTVITGPSTWDGILNALQVVTDLTSITPTVASDKEAKNVVAWEVGAGTKSLTFSKAVRIVFAGQYGKSVGYIKDGVFNQIATTCAADTQATGDALAAGGDCAIGVSPDLVVWTKHFTQYATYDQADVSLPTPVFAAEKSERDSNKYIKVSWTGVGGGVEQYLIMVNSVISATVTAQTSDSGITYSQEIKVLNDGKFDVSVLARKNGINSQGTTKTVDYTPVTVTQETEAPAIRSSRITTQPSSAQAAEETTTATPVTTDEESDANGIIKGDEKTEDEKVNWTPWIILFILIILAGAATGGYFYWFGDEEEEVDATIDGDDLDDSELDALDVDDGKVEEIEQPKPKVKPTEIQKAAVTVTVSKKQSIEPNKPQVQSKPNNQSNQPKKKKPNKPSKRW